MKKLLLILGLASLSISSSFAEYSILKGDITKENVQQETDYIMQYGHEFSIGKSKDPVTYEVINPRYMKQKGKDAFKFLEGDTSMHNNREYYLRLLKGAFKYKLKHSIGKDKETGEQIITANKDRYARDLMFIIWDNSETDMFEKIDETSYRFTGTYELHNGFSNTWEKQKFTAVISISEDKRIMLTEMKKLESKENWKKFDLLFNGKSFLPFD